MHKVDSTPLVMDTAAACSDFVTSHAAGKIAHGIEDRLRAEQGLAKRHA